MPGSIETLVERTVCQIEASAERCVASYATLMQTTEVIAMTREAIVRGRSKIASLAPRDRRRLTRDTTLLIHGGA